MKRMYNEESLSVSHVSEEPEELSQACRDAESLCEQVLTEELVLH